MSAMPEKMVKAYLAPLLAGRIVGVGVSEDGFPSVKVLAATGETFELEVSQDAEGNGPGFLFGLPWPDGGQ